MPLHQRDGLRGVRKIRPAPGWRRRKSGIHLHRRTKRSGTAATSPDSDQDPFEPSNNLTDPSALSTRLAWVNSAPLARPAVVPLAPPAPPPCRFRASRRANSVACAAIAVPKRSLRGGGRRRCPDTSRRCSPSYRRPQRLFPQRQAAALRLETEQRHPPPDPPGNSRILRFGGIIQRHHHPRHFWECRNR